MTFTLITGNDTTPVVMDGFDDFLMLPGASLVTTGDEAIDVTGNEQNISVLGTIYANGDTTTPTIDVSGDENEVYIGQDGFVGNANTIATTLFVTGNGNTIVNDGRISAGIGVFFATDPAGAPNRLVNNGTIAGLDSEGVRLRGDFLENFGLISGGVEGNSSDDVIRNLGSIQGDVNLSSGSDSYNGFGGGLVTGFLGLGADNDTAFIDQPDLFIDGGTGNDTLYARSDVLGAFNFEEIVLLGDGDIVAFGDDTTTRMIGNSGSNDLLGSEADTIMLAGAGNDVVEGFGGNDTIRGNGGGDFLSGGNSEDVIFGGTGDDTIIGGRGRDIMYGEQGADVFVYVDALDSAANPNRDIILGFQRGRDEIDVSAVNDDSFTFVGTSGFTAAGGIELGYRVVAGGTQVVVEMDVNGDGVVDSEIRLRGVSELSADDFVL